MPAAWGLKMHCSACGIELDETGPLRFDPRSPEKGFVQSYNLPGPDDPLLCPTCAARRHIPKKVLSVALLVLFAATAVLLLITR